MGLLFEWMLSTPFTVENSSLQLHFRRATSPVSDPYVLEGPLVQTIEFFLLRPLYNV